MEKGDGEKVPPVGNDQHVGADVSLGPEGTAKVKVVYPVPRELNPNAKPFRSVKEELRCLVGGTNPITTSFNAQAGSSRAPQPQLPMATSNPAVPNVKMGGGPSCSSRQRFSDPTINVNHTSEGEIHGKFGRSKVLPGDSYYSSVSQSQATLQNNWAAYDFQRQNPPQTRYMSRGNQREDVNFDGNNWFGSNRQAQNSAIELLEKMNTRLEEHSVLQAHCSRQLFFLVQKLEVVQARLDAVEECMSAIHSCGEEEWRRMEPGYGYPYKNSGVGTSKTHGRQLSASENYYWQYFMSGFPNDGGSTAPISEQFSVGSEPLANNNLTLNNKVPPGSRANNFYDNFRSYSQLNLLTTPKNVAGTVGSGRELNSSSTESRGRNSGNAPIPNIRTGGALRHPFSTTDFVENIGTKLRNQENENQPRSMTFDSSRRNCSGVPLRPPNRRESIGLTLESGADGDGTSKSIIDIVSLFLEKNGDHPDFILSLFEKLGHIQTDADRNRILSTLSSLLPTKTDHSQGRMLLSDTFLPLPDSGRQDYGHGAVSSVSYSGQSRSPMPSTARRQSHLRSQYQTTELESVPRRSAGNSKRNGVCGEENKTSGGFGHMLQRLSGDMSVDRITHAFQASDEPILERSCWAPTSASAIDDGWGNSTNQESASSEVDSITKSWWSRFGRNANSAVTDTAGVLNIEVPSLSPTVVETSAVDSNEESNEENDGTYPDTSRGEGDVGTTQEAD